LKKILLPTLLLLSVLSASAAEPGVKDDEILLGSCSGLSGPVKDLAEEHLLGAKTYVRYINDQGGINGRKLKLLAADDEYDPAKAVACFQGLLKEGVFAGAFFQGTPTAVQHAKMAEANKLPIVGIFSGAQFLHEPFKRYILNVRASSQDEVDRVVDRLWDDAGLRKVGVIYQYDALGSSLLEVIKKSLRRRGAAPAAVGSFKRGTMEVDDAIKEVRDAGAEVVFLAGAFNQAAEIAKRSKAAGWNPTFVGVSGWTDTFIKVAGPASEGAVLTQVVPPAGMTSLPAVALYAKMLAKYSPGAKPGLIGLEAFVDGIVLAEGLKRAGRDLTREKLIDAVESIRDFDIGLGPDFKVNYSPTRHKAFDSDFVSVVRNGAAVPLKDWKQLKK
jgi:ABC-type branched-subunit amino acid transport system substrate-binding protein